MRHDTLASLIEKIDGEHAMQHDIIGDTRRMSVPLETDVFLLDTENGVERFRMSEHALGQIATDLGIPKRYFDRMAVDAPELYRQNVHHWMWNDPKTKLIRGLRNGEDTYKGRAWLSNRYRRLDNIEISRKLLPEFERLSTEAQFHNASVTDERFYLRATFPRMTKDVKVGDAVTWGVQIRNSEVGAATFAIESFMLRLVCLNGMVVAKVLNARHVGKRMDDVLSTEAVEADDKAFWLAARDTLRASIDETAFEAAIDTLRETTEGTKIQSPITATKRLASSFSLSEEETETVLLNLSTGGDFTRWGALNAVTATAQSVENFDRGVELEEIGWNIANLPRKEWEKIAVAV